MCSAITLMRSAVASMRRRITCRLSPLALRSSLLACFITRSQCARAFGERVGAVLLAAQITERAPLCFSLIIAITLDQVIASRVAGSA